MSGEFRLPKRTFKTQEVAGTAHVPMLGAIRAARVQPNESFRVNVYVRRRLDAPPFDPFAIGALPPRKRTYLSREKFAELYGADPADLRKVKDFGSKYGLTAIASSIAKCMVTLEGPAAAFEKAFSTTLHVYVSNPLGVAYRAHTGAMYIPMELRGVVTEVIGLDERPVARPSASRHSGVFDPARVAAASAAGTAAGLTVLRAQSQSGTATADCDTGQTPNQKPLSAPNPSKFREMLRMMALDAGVEFVMGLLAGNRQEQQDAAVAFMDAVLDSLDIKTPPQVAKVYNFPPEATGKGQCIGIIELGGGYYRSDMDIYFQYLGFPTPAIVDVSIAGRSNRPGIHSDIDAEVAVDMQVAGGAAPGAKLAVYWAPLTALGFIDAVHSAIHDDENRPSVISASYDLCETFWQWTPSVIHRFEAVLAEASLIGVTICCSSGDYGSGGECLDGHVAVDYPSSSSYVLACGGTTLIANGTERLSEVAWNTLEVYGQATCGGVSEIFDQPEWQSNVDVPTSLNESIPDGYGFFFHGIGPGRGVPDVAGNANPETGYLVQFDHASGIIAGTSSVAPLYAALIARINESIGVPVGYINPYLYAHAEGSGAFFDIIEGNNGGTLCNTNPPYSMPPYFAKEGWDPCTGWGSPNGVKLRDLLNSEEP